MPDNSNRFERFCVVCGASFLADAWRIGKGLARFCSRGCFQKSRDNRTERICLVCAAPFMASAAALNRKNGGRYCSNACRSASMRKPDGLAPRVTLSCARCGDAFTVLHSVAMRTKQRYCSKSCSSGDPPQQLCCPVCNVAFMAFPSQVAAGRKYCSKRCENIGRRKRVLNTCQLCASVFETTPAGRHPYCSPTCASRSHLDKFPTGPAAKLWKGGAKTERGNETRRAVYREWRIAVYARDNYTCQECGKRGTDAHVNAHHRIPWADSPELRYDVANGVTLCQECHWARHRGAPRPGRVATP